MTSGGFGTVLVLDSKYYSLEPTYLVTILKTFLKTLVAFLSNS